MFLSPPSCVLRDDVEKLHRYTLRVGGEQVFEVQPLDVDAHLCYPVNFLKGCSCLLLALSCYFLRQVLHLHLRKTVYPDTR